MKTFTHSFRFVCGLALALPVAGAEALGDKLQHRVDEWSEEAKAWAALPAVVDAVAAQNAQMPAEYATLT